MAVNLMQFDALLKTYYGGQRIDNICNKDRPLLGWLERDTSFYGRNKSMPIQYGLPVGMGATFTSAQANANGGSYEEFLLTRVRDYGIIDFDNETMEASESNTGAWMKAKTIEIEGVFEALAERLAHNVVTNYGNSMARGASFTNDELTLANADDVVHFWKGQRIQSATTDGTSGALKSGYVTITGIDRDAGILTADQDWDTGITSFAGTDYLFNYGDFGLGLHGLESWLPSTPPGGSDDFFGVNRSVDTRLSGVRFDATGYSDLGGIERALARGRREGCRPDAFFVNQQRFTEMSLELGSQYQRGEVKIGAVGYDVIKFHSGGRSVSIMADNNIPYATAFGLTKSTWKLCTLKKAPRFLWTANGNMIPLATADGVQFRMGWYGQLACNAPGRNMRVTLQS